MKKIILLCSILVFIDFAQADQGCSIVDEILDIPDDSIPYLVAPRAETLKELLDEVFGEDSSEKYFNEAKILNGAKTEVDINEPVVIPRALVKEAFALDKVSVLQSCELVPNSVQEE